jgi:hypothetical protein
VGGWVVGTDHSVGGSSDAQARHEHAVVPIELQRLQIGLQGSATTFALDSDRDREGSTHNETGAAVTVTCILDLLHVRNGVPVLAHIQSSCHTATATAASDHINRRVCALCDSPLLVMPSRSAFLCSPMALMAQHKEGRRQLGISV